MATVNKREEMMNDIELQRLRARIGNLEGALHAMWAMLSDLQPPATQDSINSMMSDHFEAMKDLGATTNGPIFERAWPNLITEG